MPVWMRDFRCPYLHLWDMIQLCVYRCPRAGSLVEHEWWWQLKTLLFKLLQSTQMDLVTQGKQPNISGYLHGKQMPCHIISEGSGGTLGSNNCTFKTWYQFTLLRVTSLTPGKFTGIDLVANRCPSAGSLGIGVTTSRCQKQYCHYLARTSCIYI